MRPPGPTVACAGAGRSRPARARPVERSAARDTGRDNTVSLPGATTPTGIGRRQVVKALGVSAFAVGGVWRTSARAAPATDVLVLGAGLAGLAAARRLADAGVRPLVLEARERPGGRAYSRFDLPDRPEFGAVEVGDSYTRLRALARDCGLDIRPFAHGISAGLTLHVNGHTLNADDWPDSPANSLTAVERPVLPGRLESHYLARAIPLARAGDWDALSSRLHDRSISAVLRERGASEEALRLVNVAGNHNHSDEASVLGWWRGALARRADSGVGRFVAGTGALPVCLAARLDGAVRYASVVTEIGQDGELVRARLADGTEHRARHCVCTLPLPALGDVRLRLPLDSAMRRAIAAAAYTRVTVALFDADPFWEDDGLPLAMWTDTPLERLFPRLHPATGACIGFKAWVNGAGTTALDRLNEAAFERLALDTFARVRPSSTGRVRYLARHAWGADPFAGGAYAAWAPGQVAELRAAVRQPAGRVWFAGEHTAAAPGMEGAVRSGERAAAAILKAAS